MTIGRGARDGRIGGLANIQVNSENWLVSDDIDAIGSTSHGRRTASRSVARQSGGCRPSPRNAPAPRKKSRVSTTLARGGVTHLPHFRDFFRAGGWPNRHALRHSMLCFPRMGALPIRASGLFPAKILRSSRHRIEDCGVSIAAVQLTSNSSGHYRSVGKRLRLVSLRTDS